MPIFFAFFDFAERIGKVIWANPVLRWVVLVLTGLFVGRVWLWLRDKGRDKRVRKEITHEIIEDIQEQSDEAIQRVEDDRDAVARLNDEQLRKLATESQNNRGRLRRSPAD